MPTIENIRLANIQYNNGKSMIRDLTFATHSASTLMNLENGGGKTVINQLCHAPYVFRNDRNFGKRKFYELFPYSTPSFILHEWQMDDNAGRFVVGMIIGKHMSRQSDENEEQSRLNMYAFVEEFGNVENEPIHDYELLDGSHYRTWQQAKDYLGQMASNTKRRFFLYNLNNSAQRQAYQDHLLSLGISLSEWKQMRIFNQEESGVAKFSELYPDETSLLNKMILPAIQKKLESDASAYSNKTSMVELITENLQQYIQNVQDHQQDLAVYDLYKDFTQFLESLQMEEEEILGLWRRLQNMEETIYSYALTSQNQQHHLDQEKVRSQNLLEEQKARKVQLTYQKLSLEWHQINARREVLQQEYDSANEESQRLEESREERERTLHTLQGASKWQEVLETEARLSGLKARLESLQAESSEAQKHVNALGSAIYAFIIQELEQDQQVQAKREETLAALQEMKKELAEKISFSRKEITKLNKQIAILQTQLKQYDKQEQSFCSKYDVEFHHGWNPYGHISQVEELENECSKQIETDTKELEKQKRKLAKLQQALKQEQAHQIEIAKNQTNLKKDIQFQTSEIEKLEEQYDRQMKLASRHFAMDASDHVFDRSLLQEKTREQIRQSQQSIRDLHQSLFDTQRHLRQLETGASLEISEDIQLIADELGIELQFASKWMREGKINLNTAKKYIRRYPTLPYSLIMSAREKELFLQALKERKIYTSSILPVLEREILEQENTSDLSQYFYALYNTEQLQPALLKEKKREVQNQIDGYQQKIALYEKDLESWQQDLNYLENDFLSQAAWDTAHAVLEKLEAQLDEINEQMAECHNALNQMESDIQSTQQSQKDLENSLKLLKAKAADCSTLKEELKQALENKELLDKTESILSNMQKELTEQQSQDLDLDGKIGDLRYEIKTFKDEIRRKKEESLEFKNYTSDQVETGSIAELKERYNSWKNHESFRSVKEIQSEITSEEGKAQKSKNRFEAHLKTYELDSETVKNTPVNLDLEDQLPLELKQLESQRKMVEQQIKKLTRSLGAAEESLRNLMQRILEETSMKEVLDQDQIPSEDFDVSLAQTISMIQACQDEISQLDSNIQFFRNLQDNAENMVAGISFADRPVQTLDFQHMDRNVLRKELNSLKENLDQNRKVFSAKSRQIANKMTDYKNSLPSDQQTLLDILNQLSELSVQPIYFMTEFNRQYELVKGHLEEVAIVKDQAENFRNATIDLMYDYILQLHEQLNRIDSSMHIELDGVRKPMMRILSPKLERNDLSNRQKIGEFIDESVEEVLNGVQDVQLIWKTIKPSTLFGLLIPSHLVKIKVRKVEEHRDEIVNWSEVAKQSGAERFLSSMIVMLALLYYQRSSAIGSLASSSRPTTIFMDNPFAYVQSEHVIEPLFSLLKQTKTQMIALSKVENATVINSFPNIYSLLLKLYADGKYHVEAEHTKDAVQMETIHLEVI